MDLITKHGRCTGKHILSDQILTDDHDNHTCRSDIFLYAAIDHTVFCHIYRLGQKAAGYICNQGLTLGIGQGLEFRTVDGIILAYVHVIGILTDGQIGAIGNIREGLILRRSDLICLAVQGSLLICLLRPLTGYDVVCHTVLHQVHGDHGKLLGCSSLKEKYLVGIFISSLRSASASLMIVS